MSPVTTDRALLAWVEAHRDPALDLLRRFVEMETPARDKALVDALGWELAGLLAAEGAAVRRYPQAEFGDHVVGELEGAGAPVLLCGHFDTVYEVGTVGARPMEEHNGSLYGPGALDMKAGLVIILTVLRALREFACPRPNVRVIFNSDEEPGSPTSRPLWPEWATGARAAFVLEPATSGTDLVVRRKGVGIWTMRVRGRAAHAGAEPENGASAIRELARKIVAVEDLADAARGTTINVGVIRGGTHAYVVPEFAEAVVDIRVPDAEEQARVESGLRILTDRVVISSTATDLRGSFHRPPLTPAPGTQALIDTVRSAGERVGLCDLGFGMGGGASDGNNLAALGIPTIDGMGPAGSGAHSETEHLEVESFFQRIALLAASLEALA